MTRIVIAAPQPSQTEKEFLRKLGQSTPDLEETVNNIYEAKRSNALFREFERNPFQLDSTGQRRFSVKRFEEPDTNLLDVFDTMEEVREYTQEDWCDTTERATGLHLRGEYFGPKITLLPDTNIEIDPWYASFMASLTRNGAIKKEVITLVAQESQPGGLHRKFGNKFKPELLKAHESLIKRCPEITRDQRKEAKTLYEVVREFFGSEAEQVFNMARKYRTDSPEDIAAKFIETTQTSGYDIEAYQEMITKMVEKFREDKPNNPITDRVLTATGFGMNLINSSFRPTVVVSNDQDLTSVFDAFQQEILPRYMAKVALQAIKARNPLYVALPGYEARTIEAAREHISWASKFPQIATVGILYNPKLNRVYTRQVAEAFKQFFGNAEAYRHGKSEMLEQMGLFGLSADEALTKLLERKTLKKNR